MKHKTEIEAALERSLRGQLKVPPLGRSFDSKVWARIEAKEHPTSAVPESGALVNAGRWLRIVNVIGLAGAAIFASFFGAQMLAGADIAISLPEISAAASERLLLDASTLIAAGALAVGLMFTPLGRRLRKELG